jgi:hypothetical protein
MGSSLHIQGAGDPRKPDKKNDTDLNTPVPSKFEERPLYHSYGN